MLRTGNGENTRNEGKKNKEEIKGLGLLQRMEEKIKSKKICQEQVKGHENI